MLVKERTHKNAGSVFRESIERPTLSGMAPRVGRFKDPVEAGRWLKFCAPASYEE